MGRSSREIDWPHVRALYEVGATAHQIAQRPGMPCRQAIHERSQREGWMRPEVNTARSPALTAAFSIKSDKFDDATLRTLLDLMAEGATLDIALRACGVSKRTWHRWQAQDPAIKVAVQRARAGTITSWLATIQREAQKSWRPATWLLEHSPDTRADYGRAQSDGAGVEVVINIDRESRPTTVIEARPEQRRLTGEEEDE